MRRTTMLSCRAFIHTQLVQRQTNLKYATNCITANIQRSTRPRTGRKSYQKSSIPIICCSDVTLREIIIVYENYWTTALFLSPTSAPILSIGIIQASDSTDFVSVACKVTSVFVVCELYKSIQIKSPSITCRTGLNLLEKKFIDCYHNLNVISLNTNPFIMYAS